MRITVLYIILVLITISLLTHILNGISAPSTFDVWASLVALIALGVFWYEILRPKLVRIWEWWNKLGEDS